MMRISTHTIDLISQKAAQFICVAFLVGIPLQSIAQLNLEEDIKRCTSILDSVSRLDCYDQIGELFKQELTSIPVITAPAKAAEKEDTVQPPELVTTKDTVGAKYIQKGQKEKKSYSGFDFVLVDMQKNSRGLWEFQFENDQLWRQLEAKYMSKPKSFPANVQISKGSFGSHSLKIMPKGKSVKVRRLK